MPMLYQLSKVNIQLPAWIFMAFIKSCSINSKNDQSAKCEVMHKTKLTSENTRLTQTVEHYSDDPEVLGSILTGGQFLTNFFTLPRVEICHIIWQKRVSWKTRLSLQYRHLHLLLWWPSFVSVTSAKKPIIRVNLSMAFIGWISCLFPVTINVINWSFHVSVLLSITIQ